MAQVVGLKYVENPNDGVGAQCPWPAPSSAFGSSYEHEDEHGNHHHGKKSVLAKVKEKAKKLKRNLSKKMHGHDNSDDGHFTPEWGSGLDADDRDEEDPESQGAPMNESNSAPDACKAAATQMEQHGQHPDVQHPKTLGLLDSFKERNRGGQLDTPAVLVADDKHAPEAKDIPEDPATGNGGNKTLTETVSEMLAPACVAVAGATRMITSKIQSPRAAEGGDQEAISKKVWDKGVSVKEYLMQKLEPGEDEKALSEFITEAISPKKGTTAGGGEAGVVEKVKGAVTSLLGMEKPASPAAPSGSHEIPWASSASKDVQPVLSSSKSQPLSVSTSHRAIHLVSSKSQPIQLSSRPQPASLSTVAQPKPAHNSPKSSAAVTEEEQPVCRGVVCLCL